MKNINKGPLCLLLAAMLLLGAPAASFAAQTPSDKGEISVYMDGVRQEYAVQPLNVYGTVMVPARGIFEALGAEVTWNQSGKEVIADRDGTKIIIIVGSSVALSGSQVTALSQPTMLHNGTVMVPARFVSETFRCKVDWDSKNRTVNISTKAAEPEESLVKILSYEDAVAVSIRKNYNYQKAQIGLSQAEQNNKNLIVSYSYYNPLMWQGKNDLNIAEKWAGINLEITQEQTANSTKNMMDDINLLLKERSFLEKKGDFLKESVRIAKAKLDNGIISTAEFDAEELKLKSAKQELSSLSTKISAAYIDLYSALYMTGSTEMPLEYDVNYAPVGEVDLQKKYKQELETDPYIWYVNQNVESADYRLSTYQYNIGEKDYELTRLDLVNAKSSRAETERKFQNAIESRYNTLLQLENGIASIDLQIVQALANLNAKVKLYDHGMSIKLDLQEIMVSINSLEYEKAKLMQQHSQAKAIFEKLYLAPDYM